MLNFDGQEEHQDRLLKSLRHKVSVTEMPKPSLKVKPVKPSIYRSGRGTTEDHMMLIKNYICQCGRKFSDVSHTIEPRQNGTALDTFRMNCGNCGDEEEVSFMSMRQTLKAASKSSSFDKNNKRLYPYL